MSRNGYYGQCGGQCVYILAVPRNLFYELQIPNPISGPHINTFGCNNQYRFPGAPLQNDTIEEIQTKSRNFSMFRVY